MRYYEFDYIADKLEEELGINHYRNNKVFNEFLWAVIGGYLAYSKEQGISMDDALNLCAESVKETKFQEDK